MSQAISSFTPLQSSYPGNFQQQVSAAVAPSSSSMANGDVIVLGGVLATTLLLGVGGLVAMKQLGTSSAKKPATYQVPPTPVERGQLSQSQRERRPESADEMPPHQPQAQSTPEATKKRPPPQVTPPKPVKRPQMPQLRIKPTPVSTKKIPQGQIHPNKALLGEVDEYGVYWEGQVKGDGLCGLYAVKTVLYHFFGEKKVKEITKEKFREKVPGPGSRIGKLVDFVNENGLDTREYYSERIGGAGITSIENGIEDAEAFIISRARSSHGFHAVAMVRKNGFFHLSDPGHKDRREIYPGTVNEATREYERRNNYTVDAVTTFHKSAYAQGRHLNDPFTAASTEGISERGGHEVLR